MPAFVHLFACERIIRRCSRHCVLVFASQSSRHLHAVLTLSQIPLSSLHPCFFCLQPAVPETALKKRKRDDAWAAKKAAAAADAKSNAEKNSTEIFKRAEKYVKEYRDQVRGDAGAARDGKKHGERGILRLRVWDSRNTAQRCGGT